MAGIAGIIAKTPESKVDQLPPAFSAMMRKMSFSDQQLRQTFISENICFGNVVPVSCQRNEHYQHNSGIGVYAVIDGIVFVDSDERSKIARKYNIRENQSDYSLIPFLYQFYDNGFVTHITGSFNIFIYDDKKGLSLLLNDRLGFLPLYYCESDAYFIFASKMEAVLSSGLLPSIKPDPVTIAEHLFFNYPISDHTYITDIYTLPNACVFKNTRHKTTRAKYWSVSELYGHSPANKQDSFHLINEGLNQAVRKVIDRCENRVNFTLTGGWDSRVVLSCLLPKYKNKLNIFSFGAEHSGDILIPQQIAKTEGLDYTPYILDHNYLENSFLPNALNTIKLSSGVRNYKRTHYLYAVQKIAAVSDVLVTGIFGDEVLKVGRPSGNAVLSQNMINLIESNFNIAETLKKFTGSFILNCLNEDQHKLIEDLNARLESLKQRMDALESICQKYYSFRFEYNLRKYFGYEASSYNDFVFGFSPFTDCDFLNNFARTRYFGAYHPYGTSNIRFKKRSTKLYHDIVETNYKPLAAYNSDKGYSLKDANNVRGNLKIIYKRYVEKNRNTDVFNTRATDDLFRSFLEERQISPGTFNSVEIIDNTICDPNLLSLLYWIGEVEERYGG